MVLRAFQSFMVSVHTNRAPTDAEWGRVLDEYRQRASDMDSLRVLVYAEGGAPNARQRAALNEVTVGKKLRVAILTSSPIARAVGTAMGWFNPLFRVFGTHELERALDHLQVKGPDRQRLSRTLDDARMDLFGRPRVTPPS
jgi:hypothetical protein